MLRITMQRRLEEDGGRGWLVPTNVPSDTSVDDHSPALACGSLTSTGA
jgi:hypothetical protein